MNHLRNTIAINALKKILILFISILSLNGFGQTGGQSNNGFMPSITRPSPTVTQLMKIEESQIDNYTGQPNIGVPLFNKTIKNLDVAVSLSYNSSGIRVVEQSGWVGKGWSLNAGGVVSRSVVDLPDEILTDKYIGANNNSYHDFFSISEQEQREYIYDAEWATRISLDSKNDVYQFNFFGKTGRFVFTKINSVLQPVMVGEDNNYKIAVTYINTTSYYYPTEIESFVITDDSGYKYYFTEIERTEKNDVTFVYNQSGCDGQVAPSNPMSIGKFISAWHLSKVEDENGIKLLDVTYYDVVEKPKEDIYSTTYNVRDMDLVKGSPCSDATGCMRCALKPLRIDNTPFRTLETKKINKIIFRDNSYFQFFISNSHPEYLEEKGAYLTRIELHNNQQAPPIKTFNFEYTSFVTGLFLDAVKTNNSALDKFTFEYYNKGQYPIFGTLEKDIFGYYNAAPFKESIYTGVLTKVTYPTKGTKEFTWEPNTYSYKGDKLLTFNEIYENPDNYSLDTNHFVDPYANQSVSIPKPYEIINIYLEQDVDFNAMVTANGSIDTTMPNWLEIVPILSEVNESIDPTRTLHSIIMDIGESKSGTLHLKGAYKIYFNSLNYSLDHVKIRGSVTLQIKQPKTKLNWWLYGGGIRVKTIKDTDNSIDQIIKEFRYNQENPGIIPTDLPPFLILPGHEATSLFFSNGALDGIDKLVREYTSIILPIFNRNANEDFSVLYDVTEQQSQISAELTKGSYIGYRNVYEYFYPNTPLENLNYKSKIKYTYDSPIEHPSIVSDDFYNMPTISYTHLQGNIRKKEYFDSMNRPVQVEEFKYNYDIEDIREGVKKNYYFSYYDTGGWGECQQVRLLYASYDSLITHPFISSAGYETPCDSNCLVGEQPSNFIVHMATMDKAECLVALTPHTFIWDYKYKVLLSEDSKKEYFGTETIESKETYNYNYKNNLASKTSLLATGETIETQYFYCTDAEIDNEQFKAQLNSKNMIALPLRTVSLKNNEIVSVQQTKYGSVAASGPVKTNQIPSFALPLPLQNMLVPREVFSRKGDNEENMEKKLTFLKYDIQGNVLEVRQEDGMNVCYIWGYNKTLPVAKIENMNYDYISPLSLITNIENATNAVPYSETNFIAALDALRAALTTSMVTGYQFKPEVGMTAVIDPRGYKTTYHYDAFGRLEYVKDHQGHILSANKYNYRP